MDVIQQGNAVKGVIVESKQGRLAMLADIQADIERGRLKAREEAQRRAAR